MIDFLIQFNLALFFGIMGLTMELIEPTFRLKNLINAEDCFILIIDVQSFFIQEMDEKQKDELLDKCNHLVQLASLLKLPIIITAENIKKNGTFQIKLLTVCQKPYKSLINSSIAAGDKKVFEMLSMKRNERLQLFVG